MSDKSDAVDCQPGFEQGPIRPPSEAHSLLIRVSRNCTWNRCTFCPVYKGTKFSLRPVADVKRDIDLVHKHVENLRQLADTPSRLSPGEVGRLAETIDPYEALAFNAALDWFVVGGLKAVFLQDANSLAIKPADLVEILTHLKRRFPKVKRITSYARSDTIARRTEEDLRAIAEAGLDRLHIGLESGSDEVLAMACKGVTKEKHIVAGIKVKQAGMELSEYVMPGLGGQTLSDVHARETADALNQINPDFIRLRTLAIPDNIPLYEDYQAGRFRKCTDTMVAQELLTFVEHLDGITSVLASDHILNLLQDVRGTFPRDKEHVLNVIRRFLSLSPSDRMLYQVGRRVGLFSHVGHLDSDHRRAEAERICRQLGVTPENVDAITDEMSMQFV